MDTLPKIFDNLFLLQKYTLLSCNITRHTKRESLLNAAAGCETDTAGKILFVCPATPRPDNTHTEYIRNTRQFLLCSGCEALLHVPEYFHYSFFTASMQAVFWKSYPSSLTKDKYLSNPSFPGFSVNVPPGSSARPSEANTISGVFSSSDTGERIAT